VWLANRCGRSPAAAHGKEPFAQATATSMNRAYQLVTEQILAALERGVVPWRQPWKGADDAPQNLATGRPYRGVNVLLLQAVRTREGYGSPWWLTFNQARGLRGHVRKGERATHVVYWHPAFDLEEPPKPPREVERTPGFALRYYYVFNTDQCDRLDARIPCRAHPLFQPIERAARIVDAMATPPLLVQGSDTAYYRPSDDSVHLPEPTAFHSAEAYYATMFHELTHATGHPTRLGRFPLDASVAPFASPDYSAEELVAEMGAAFLCGDAGIVAATLDWSASYVESWLRVLNGDPALVIFAASRAQKAADLILGRSHDTSR
jgi:antirestriction protein ArdC